jgi:hypothetical protein
VFTRVVCIEISCDNEVTGAEGVLLFLQCL